MNRAAEAAVPEAKALLVSAVRNLGVGLPIVKKQTERVDLASRFNAVVGR